MIKKFTALFVTLLMWSGIAFAQVDINKADQAALDGIKGIGPKMSQKILDERVKGGNFKDWNDVQSRVKGIKEKSAIRLSTAGLTVNGQSKNGAPAAVPSAAAAKKGGAVPKETNSAATPEKAPAVSDKAPAAKKIPAHADLKK